MWKILCNWKICYRWVPVFLYSVLSSVNWFSPLKVPLKTTVNFFSILIGFGVLPAWVFCYISGQWTHIGAKCDNNSFILQKWTDLSKMTPDTVGRSIDKSWEKYLYVFNRLQGIVFFHVQICLWIPSTCTFTLKATERDLLEVCLENVSPLVIFVLLIAIK